MCESDWAQRNHSRATEQSHPHEVFIVDSGNLYSFCSMLWTLVMFKDAVSVVLPPRVFDYWHWQAAREKMSNTSPSLDGSMGKMSIRRTVVLEYCEKRHEQRCFMYVYKTTDMPLRNISTPWKFILKPFLLVYVQ